MHTEVLTPEGKGIFPVLKNFPGFYLAGGTALALQLGHRVSADFDLFSGQDIPKTLLAAVEKIFSGRSLNVSVNNSDELTVFVDGVKTTFLRYPFPVLRELAEYNGLQILSGAEISATKSYTIGRRGSFKDYVDLYYSIAEGVTDLSEIIDLAENKYGNNFNSRLFLEQLVYTSDVSDTEIVFLKKPVSKKELEDFFTGEIQKIKI